MASRQRAKVETEGSGARLLSCRDQDSQSGGWLLRPRSGFDPREWREVGQPMDPRRPSPCRSIRQFDLDPSSDPGETSSRTGRASTRAGTRCGQLLSGPAKIEECINGRTVADGAYCRSCTSASIRRQAGRQRVSPTAARTARGAAARSARRSPARSTCRKASSIVGATGARRHLRRPAVGRSILRIQRSSTTLAHGQALALPKCWT